MPRKKSGKKAAQDFVNELTRIEQYLDQIDASPLTDQAITWSYEAAIVKAHVAFERLMLNCLVVAINNNTATLGAASGITFPRHMTDEVCEYLVTGGGYFDFQGRDGLIKKIYQYVPATHWLPTVVKDPSYTATLNHLSAFRNYAAHESSQSRRRAMSSVSARRMSSAGAWLKVSPRLRTLLRSLQGLGNALAAAAPY